MTALRQFLLAAVVASALCYAFEAHGYADTIVVPTFLTHLEGNDKLYPVDDFHIQQVYASSEFSALDGPIRLSQIAFRPDAGFQFIGATSRSTRIRLSTTAKSPDGLSTTFAENVGADEVFVFDGELTTSSAFTGPEGGPKDFDIIINFTTPFLYDPAAGNLLLDLRVTGELFSMSYADAEDTFGDSISRVTGNGSESTTGVASTSGFVTRFGTDSTTNPVPEPGSLILLGSGVAGVIGALRRRNKTR